MSKVARRMDVNEMVAEPAQPLWRMLNRTKSHRVAPLVVGVLLSCGGDRNTTISAPDAPSPQPSSGPFVVSATQPAPPSSAAAPGASADAVPASVVYVSLAPESIPNANVVTIRVRATGANTSVAAIDGGFDPVVVSAGAGDTLDITVSLTGSAPPVGYTAPVPKKPGRPVVIRTSPPHGKRDVPLNTDVLVVFSEPIAASSLVESSIHLTSAAGIVAGTLTFGDIAHVTATFTPSAPLAASTAYTISIAQSVQAVDGQTLQAPVTADFTTATQAEAVSAPSGQIAFVGGPYAAGQIFLMNADGSGVRQITFGPSRHLGPSWSPDGAKIAYISADGVSDPQLGIMNADGSEPTQVTNGEWPYEEAAWSPDGRRIAFSRMELDATTGRATQRIGVINVDGSGLTMLTPVAPVGHADLQPTWSADGSRIAFTYSAGDGVTPNFVHVVSTTSASGGGSASLFPAGNECSGSAPAWSPDGSQLLIWSVCLRGLAVENVDGTGAARPVAPGLFVAPMSYAHWSPDGAWIVFNSLGPFDVAAGESVPNPMIYVTHPDGSGTLTLVPGFAPAWRPNR